MFCEFLCKSWEAKVCVCKAYVGRRKDRNLYRNMNRPEVDSCLGQEDKCGTKLESATARIFETFGDNGRSFSMTSAEMEMTWNDSSDSFFISQLSCLQILLGKVGCPYCGLIGTCLISMIACRMNCP